jgi:hypothetical protein
MRETATGRTQLTIGELINLIGESDLIMDDGSHKTIEFDFISSVPNKLHSWRGSYDEAAISVENQGVLVVNAADFLQYIKQCIGKTFEGWKGGEYVFYEDTPLWISRIGYSDYTVPVGVFDDGYSIIILTDYNV